jgi:hypothetical protein
VEQKARAILHSQLTPTQKLIVEAQSVLGGIKHTMATKPFTAKEIQQIDSTRSRLAKSVLGLPITAPTAAIFTTKTQYGMGQPLTAAAQTFECAKAQIDAHNDTGRLGTATRAMMSALQQQGQITTAQAEVIDGCTTITYTNLRRTRNMLPQRHNEMISNDILPEYHLSPNQTAHYTSIWEFLTTANTTLNKQFPVEVLQNNILTPLTACGKHTLDDITETSNTKIQPLLNLTPQLPQEQPNNNATHPPENLIIAWRLLAALLHPQSAIKYTDILLRPTPQLPLEYRFNMEQFIIITHHLLPADATTPAIVKKLQYLTLDRTHDENTTSGLTKVSWQPSTRMHADTLHTLETLGSVVQSKTPSHTGTAKRHRSNTELSHNPIRYWNVQWQDSWECTSALTSHELNTRETARAEEATQRMRILMQPTDTKAPIPSYACNA